MQFGWLILINLNLPLWFLNLDATSTTRVKFDLGGTFRVAVALHLRFEFLATI